MARLFKRGAGGDLEQLSDVDKKGLARLGVSNPEAQARLTLQSPLLPTPLCLPLNPHPYPQPYPHSH